MGIDAQHVAIAYLREGSEPLLVEGLSAKNTVLVTRDGHSLVAELHVVSSGIVAQDEVGLSEAAWRSLGLAEGDSVIVAEGPHVASMSHVREKIAGRRLNRTKLHAIVEDIVRGRYSELEMGAFVTACAARRLNRPEMAGLTRAMIDVGTRLTWESRVVADKHCVGGIPGNRTTMLLVPIVAAAGLVIPKTSSRAITSAAGTADTMEAVSNVNLDLATMRRVVEREGGCIAWGGAMHLSPADDLLIRVERPLELDAPGQLVASVLSKKAAAGSTHVIIDIPVGPAAKVHGRGMAQALADDLVEVGEQVGLNVRTVVTDGSQPVGSGTGPSLEARDVLSVLRREPGAPQDLRDRSLHLAGTLLELAGAAPEDSGRALAEEILKDGRALAKFLAICEAQGGFREPGIARHRKGIAATGSGRVAHVDIRAVSRVAKIAGAPEAKLAGLQVRARVGDRVKEGDELLVIHAEARGDLDRAVDFARAHGVIRLEPA